MSWPSARRRHDPPARPASPRSAMDDHPPPAGQAQPGHDETDPAVPGLAAKQAFVDDLERRALNWSGQDARSEA
jgi:hypothetical protein